MANLIVEMPDDLVRSLEGVAAAQRKSIQQLAFGLADGDGIIQMKHVRYAVLQRF